MGMFKAAKAAPSKTAPAKAAPKKIAPAKKAAARRVEDDDEEDGDDGDGIGGVTSGWGGAEKMAAEYSAFTNRLQMKEETIIVRFLDDAPFANVATHWVSRPGEKGKPVRRSYICHGKGKCPLCKIGDTPKVQYCFNVVKLTDGDPLLHSWEVGIRVYRQIEKLAKDAKTMPLSKHYYELERSGMDANNTQYKLTKVKRVSDINDEYPDLVVPDEDDIKAMDGYTVKDVTKQKNSIAEMKEVAAELAGGGDDEDDDD